MAFNQTFIRNRSGAVVIEAAFLLLFIGILIQLLIELTVRKLNQTELERVNFALAKVIRERGTLYDVDSSNFKESNILTQDQVNDLALIGRKLIKTSAPAQKNFTLRVEGAYFKTDSSSPQIEKVIVYSYGNSCAIANAAPLSDYSNLSAWTINKRWMPIYRVSICVPRGNSAIERIINRSLGLSDTISVSNIVLSR
jgi:tight adherence protein F